MEKECAASASEAVALLKIRAFRSSADADRGIFDLERAADRNRVSSGSWTRCFLRSGGMSGSCWIGFSNTGAILHIPKDTKQIQLMAPEIYSYPFPL
jgi:hypothetical protein